MIIQPGSIWNVEAVSAELDRLCSLDGLTYEHIADSMSRKFGWRITRNMCIGRAWRIKKDKKRQLSEKLLDAA